MAAVEDVESRGAKNRGDSYSSSYVVPDRDTQWTSWLIPLVIVANVAMFIVAMYINNCPKHYSGVGDKCVARFFRRFSFQPLAENPQFGPSASTLEKLGALEWTKVVHGHQGWRLLSCIWLHAGVVHLVINMVCLVFIGIRLEQQFGFVRIGVIYLLSGFGGSVLSALFIQKYISVGASGALFGLLGAMLSELITNWTIYTNRAAAVFTLLIVVIINLAVGILPHVDNFAHIGGFLTGFLLGFVLLPRPQFGWIARRNLPADVRVKSKYKGYQYVLGLVSLGLLVAGFAVGLGQMGSDTSRAVMVIGVFTLLLRWAVRVPTAGAIDCATVGALISACSSFVTYGTPDPFPGSPCCEAVASLNNLADTSDSRQTVCMCVMGLVTTYNPNATAVATLPGFCGVSLGFTIEPNTDCS
ncbi:hypothetical protein RJ640_022998 [Escallonia rubra]|uniref:Multifunctional fusion protein n=1 Tax=Escallonia rubra TaxID=112253 RepID=A0AA88SA74_9ASTE|nr:hypothetical protein RJ640_022998 [Escallonia rubra]